MTEPQEIRRPPGTCISWEEKRRELPKLCGDERLVRQVWEEVDAMAYMYIWQILLSF
jgi:hypothetical protein